MSYNDLINTGFGGIALGEVMYRMSSMVLDNRATGSGRTWREVGGFLIDPVRGFNRFSPETARAAATTPSILRTGARTIRRTGSQPACASSARANRSPSSLKTHALPRARAIAHGDVFENTRRGPFDFFDLDASGHLRREGAAGEGDRCAAACGRSRSATERSTHAPRDRPALRVPQQRSRSSSAGRALARPCSRATARPGTRSSGRAPTCCSRCSARSTRITRSGRGRGPRTLPPSTTTVPASVLALNARSAQFAGGARVGVDYRLQWLDVRNGSVFVRPGFRRLGRRHHVVQALMLRGSVPVRNGTAIAARTRACSSATATTRSPSSPTSRSATRRRASCLTLDPSGGVASSPGSTVRACGRASPPPPRAAGDPERRRGTARAAPRCSRASSTRPCSSRHRAVAYARLPATVRRNVAAVVSRWSEISAGEPRQALGPPPPPRWCAWRRSSRASRRARPAPPRAPAPPGTRPR